MFSTIFRLLFIFVLSVCSQCAFAQDAPLRLALLYPPEAASLGDLLTVELSKEAGITLLEREQIQKIFEEKSLNAAQSKQDWAKIGELLGAVGLIVLEPTEGKTVSFRLIWAERGIIVHETSLNSDEKEPQKVVMSALPQIEKAVRKLGELRHAGKSAVAMHIKAVNADSGKDHDLRQGLGLLFAQRMLDEPGWVVVERRNLVDAVFENDLADGKGEQKLVTASHRLTLGFAKEGELLKIRGQLEMPSGQSKHFEFAGKFNEPAALGVTFMTALRESMGLAENSPIQAWDPIQEANALFDWAREKYRNLYYGRSPGRDIYEAASAAWALGLREQKVSHLRTIALCEWAWPSHNKKWICSGHYHYNFVDLRKDLGAVRRMLGALDLARVERTEPIQYFEDKIPSEMTIPFWAGDMLRAIYDDHNEDLFAAELPLLRKSIREAVDALPTVDWKVAKEYSGDYVRNWKIVYAMSILTHGSLWEDDYAAAQQRIENILLTMNVKEEYISWKGLSGVLMFTRAMPVEKELEAFDRKPRYDQVTLFYPKKTEDEAECYRRSSEVMNKLAGDTKLRPLAQIVQKKLEQITGKQVSFPQQNVWESSSYLTDMHHLDVAMNDRHVKVAFEEAPMDEVAKFIIHVLSERQPGQFLVPFLFNSGKRHPIRLAQSDRRYSPDVAVQLLVEIDKYRSKMDDELLSKSSQSTMKIEYIDLIGSELESLIMSYPEAFAELKRLHPPALIPENAFQVVKYRFCKDWALSYPDLSRFLNDGRNLYVLERDITRKNITGIAALQPPNWKPKRMWGGIPTKSMSVQNSRVWFASEGRLFFMTDDNRKEVVLHCLDVNGNEANVSIDKTKCQIEFIGCFPPFVYCSVTGFNAQANGTHHLIQRWNTDDNIIDVLADSMRKPAATLLDEMANSDLAMARLPDGAHGLLARSRVKTEQNVYSIEPTTGEITLFGAWNMKLSPQPEWTKPFMDVLNGRLDDIYLTLSEDKKTQSLKLRDHFFPFRVIATVPASPFPRWLPKPVFPQVVDRSPFALCSFTLFEMGDIRGAVSIGREKGRSTNSQTDLVFFESDGIKSIPLRFDMEKSDLDRLRQFLSVDRKRGDKSIDYTPNPRVGNAGFLRSDKACVVNDTLFISNNSPEVLWFLTKEEVMEARKRATKIDANNFAKSQ